MNHSASVSSIFPALLRARAKFQPIIKTKTANIDNKFSFSYAPLEEIVHKITPALLEEGLYFMQGVEGSCLVTTIFHESGEWVSHAGKMPEAFASPRAYGSELSYRRRYGITMAFGLVSEDDDDGQQAERELAKRGKDQFGAVPSAASGAAIKRDAWEAITDEKEREFLRKIVANVIGLLDEKRDDDAHGYLENQKLDIEEQLAIAHLLSSSQRSALKRASARADQARKATTEANK